MRQIIVRSQNNAEYIYLEPENIRKIRNTGKGYVEIEVDHKQEFSAFNEYSWIGDRRGVFKMNRRQSEDWILGFKKYKAESKKFCQNCFLFGLCETARNCPERECEMLHATYLEWGIDHRTGKVQQIKKPAGCGATYFTLAIIATAITWTLLNHLNSIQK